MKIDELIKRLQQIAKDYKRDTENVHILFDEALLKYVDDETVSKIYEEETLWYA